MKFPLSAALSLLISLSLLIPGILATVCNPSNSTGELNPVRGSIHIIRIPQLHLTSFIVKDARSFFLRTNRIIGEITVVDGCSFNVQIADISPFENMVVKSNQILPDLPDPDANYTWAGIKVGDSETPFPEAFRLIEENVDPSSNSNDTYTFIEGVSFEDFHFILLFDSRNFGTFDESNEFSYAIAEMEHPPVPQGKENVEGDGSGEQGSTNQTSATTVAPTETPDINITETVQSNSFGISSVSALATLILIFGLLL
jgi:hypothetical protein